MTPTGRQIAGRSKDDIMQGYVARTGDHNYAVSYEGLDPLTGPERQ